jgi:hypothetical protein
MLYYDCYFIIKTGVKNMANRRILDSSLKRVSMIMSVQSYIREKIINLAMASNVSSSQYVEELLKAHLKEKGSL